MLKSKQEPARLTPIKPGTWAYTAKRLKESWPWYLMMLPAIIYLAIFDYAPMGGLIMAFQKYSPTKGIIGSKFVGFKHFVRYFTHPFFWKMIRNTLSITTLSLCTFPCSIIFALFLNEVTQTKFKKFAQMISYMPHFLSEVVVVSLVLLLLDLNNGPINNMIEAFGGERYYFMGDPDIFPTIYVLQSLWQGLGWGAILYISALSAVPTEQIEAARIDGASRFQIMWHINLPTILPTIMITFVMRIGSLLSLGYTRLLLFRNPLNEEVIQTISMYVYTIGLGSGGYSDYSYATAIGLVNSLINLSLLLIFNKISKLLTEVSLF